MQKKYKVSHNELSELDQYNRRQNMEALGLRCAAGKDLLCRLNEPAAQLHLLQLGANEIDANIAFRPNSTSTRL